MSSSRSKPPRIDAVALSAESEEALIAALAALLEDLRTSGETAYAARQLPRYGPQARFRVALAARDAAEATRLGERALEALKAGRVSRVLENQGVIFRDGATKGGKLAFLFTGQGAQRLNMGADLRGRYAEVSQCFAMADEVLVAHSAKPLSEHVFVTTETQTDFSSLSQTEIAQPALVTLAAALWQILGSYGARPDIVAGHSLGEYAACMAAGVLSVPDTIRAAAARGAAMASAQPINGDKGLMASVPKPTSEVATYLGEFGGRVVIANHNSPVQTIVAGYTPEMRALLSQLEAQAIRATLLAVSHAFHSEIVASASGPLRRFLQTIEVAPPQIPLLGNIDAQFYPPKADAIRDILALQVAKPVRWSDIIERMFAEGVRTFVEVGPRALTGMVADTLGDRAHRAYACHHASQGGLAGLSRLIASLWADGKAIQAPRDSSQSPR